MQTLTERFELWQYKITFFPGGGPPLSDCALDAQVGHALSYFTVRSNPVMHIVVFAQIRRQQLFPNLRNRLSLCWLLLNRGRLLGIEIQAKQKNKRYKKRAGDHGDYITMR